MPTITAALQGKRVSLDSAGKLCAALGLDIKTAFTVHDAGGALSDRTVRHHHTLIRAILAGAKKKRIIPHNVAQEFMEAPKLPRTEARYMDDEEAQTFLAALMAEPDIRVKTALTLDLFTGLRRGELCGLSWPDIDFKGNIVRVRRASQYIQKRGVIEVPTKNESSSRDIAVTPFVMSLSRRIANDGRSTGCHSAICGRARRNTCLYSRTANLFFPTPSIIGCAASSSGTVCHI